MIQQGHLYSHGVHRVIALTSGKERVKVQALTGTHPSGLGRPFNTHAMYLTPLGMKYHGGAVPGAKA